MTREEIVKALRCFASEDNCPFDECNEKCPYWMEIDKYDIDNPNAEISDVHQLCCAAADLLEQDQLEALVAQVPALDGVVLCSGKGLTLPMQFATRDKFNDIFDTNFFAPFELLRLLFKKKKIQKLHKILIIMKTLMLINLLIKMIQNRTFAVFADRLTERTLSFVIRVELRWIVTIRTAVYLLKLCLFSTLWEA